jgi:hypothetical protein
MSTHSCFEADRKLSMAPNMSSLLDFLYCITIDGCTKQNKTKQNKTKQNKTKGRISFVNNHLNCDL